MSGRSGGLVFYRIRNRQYARSHVIPADPKTPPRRLMREIMRAVSRAWSEWLTQDERQEWNLFAGLVFSRWRLDRGELTGQTFFVKISTARARIGRALLRLPPDWPVFQRNPVAGLSLRYEHGQLRLKLTVSGPVDGDFMVWAQGPCAATRKKCRKPVYLCLVPPPEGGESDITQQYVARFGEPKPGQKVFIQTREQVNGWECWPKEVSAIVPQPSRMEARGCRLGAASRSLSAPRRHSAFCPRPSAFSPLPLAPTAVPWGRSGSTPVAFPWARTHSRLLPRAFPRSPAPAGTEPKVRWNGHWRELWHGS